MSGASRIVAASWFVDQGVQTFPIVDRGKEPLVKWREYRCSRDTAAGFGNYGVALTSWFGVVDTDSDESEAFVKAHVIDTPFKVMTARGIHRYFRLARPTPKFIRRQGIAIEFRNEGQYVVGPGSVHPSGSVYTPAAWSWNIEDIPIFPVDFVFDDGSCGVRSDGPGANEELYAFPPEVTAGERHHELFKLLRSLKALGNDIDSAWWCVQQANENFCKPPLPASGLRRWFDRGWANPDRPLDTYKDVKLASLGLQL
jgi:hypothetical protein